MLAKVVIPNIPNTAVLKSTSTSAGGAAVAKTITGVAGQSGLAVLRTWLCAIQWSYSAAPTGGRLSITDDGNSIFDVDITAAGPGGFQICLPGTAGKDMVVTLAGGGGAIVGKLNLQYAQIPD